MRCVNCNKKVHKTYNICPYCGDKIGRENVNTNAIIFYKLAIAILLLALVSIVLWFAITKSNDTTNLDILKESVVQIYVYDENNEVIATGSGVIAFEDDIIITNAHVIEDNHKLEVISEDNTKYQLKGVIGYNKKKDIAILKVNNSKKLKAIKTEDSLEIGEEVIAIGSPLGLKNTVSNGIFSGYYQDEIEVYQHTAPISPGSSGGGLFDSNGKLVGITYASLKEGQNINFAIPIEEIKKEYNVVKSNTCLETEYYKYLNNGIIKTEVGSKVMDYVLNDEFRNTKFKSGVVTPNGVGYLNFLTLKSASQFEDGYAEIEELVKSSVYIFSGTGKNIYYMDIDGNITKKSGDYYEIIIIKLKNSSNDVIQAITSFFDEYFIEDSTDNAKYDVEFGNGYAYLISYENYDNIDAVKKVMKEFVQ